MRLICPNCDAQYEVDDAVIPDEGRDVQCSNCGHTWFQTPAGALHRNGSEAAAGAPDPEDVGWHDDPEAGPVEDEDEDTGEFPDRAAAATAAPDRAPRRELDPAVLDILKEEAEREQRARQEEAAVETFSSQPDLGLDAAVSAAGAAGAATAASPRRDLLPDIDEINSTLAASSDRGANSILTAEEEDARERSAFRKGFGSVVLAAALALAAYLLAPTIGGLHPALEGPMAAYVEAIDGVRLWLNTAVPQALEGATQALQGGDG